jgi:hypothetical protein
MPFVFQRGSTLVVSNEATSRQLLVASATISQTFQEDERSVKTLHSTRQISETFTNSKTPVSFDFSVHLTSYDSLLLRWFGFEYNRGESLVLPTVQSARLPSGYRVYLKTQTSWYEITKAVLTNISFDFSKSGPLLVTFTGVGSDWREVETIQAPMLTNQNSSDFLHGSLESTVFNRLAGVTLELSRDVSWRNDKSLHDLSSIYRVRDAILGDVSVSGAITNYKTSPDLRYSKSSLIDFTYADTLEFYFDPCKLLDRWETGEVHKIITDYKAQPNAEIVINLNKNNNNDGGNR